MDEKPLYPRTPNRVPSTYDVLSLSGGAPRLTSAPPRPPLLQSVGDTVRLLVRVKPRASKSRVLSVRDGALEVAVAAPPVDGEANRELVCTVARYLGLPTTAVSVARGTSGRTKSLALRGLDPTRVNALLGR